VKAFEVYGGPSWVGTEQYDIITKRGADAKDAPASKGDFEKLRTESQLKLQSLLEDRCALKVHRETKQLPIYALTVAKGGMKVTAADCVTFDFKNPPAPTPGKQPPAFCGNSGSRRNGANMVYTGTGVSMTDLVRWLSGMTSRTVIDKTGYSEPFNAKMEFLPDAAAQVSGPDNPSSDVTGPSLFTALQEQLGLKLESTKGPVEVLVIDHIERPAAN
jgi:uncharacterized protein (TIGR03435 family)